MKNKKGYFGEFGGRFVPKELDECLEKVEKAFEKYKDDEDFKKELKYYQKEYIGRANPLYFAKNLTENINGAKIYLKREDLNHTGAHKINNTIGQILLAKKMGKKRIIAETGAGQHGVATATVAALFNMDCIVYMGKKDTERQALNVYRMKLLGAEVKPVTSGTMTLKDAVDAALKDFVKNFKDTFYLLGSAVGPHPYPLMVRYFQSVIGNEAKKQILKKENKLPDYLVACIGGGSNAIGLFHPFYNDKKVKFIGVEPGGLGLDTDKHAATLTKGKKGKIHGFKCYNLQDESGKPLDVHSVSAGLDYPGVGPEHSFYKDSNRAKYVTITDKEALENFELLSKTEGIIPALESAHAVAYGVKLAKDLSNDKIIIINLSGRGDKDVQQVNKLME